VKNKDLVDPSVVVSIPNLVYVRKRPAQDGKTLVEDKGESMPTHLMEIEIDSYRVSHLLTTIREFSRNIERDHSKKERKNKKQTATNFTSL
jgi:hypothetical protein